MVLHPWDTSSSASPAHQALKNGVQTREGSAVLHRPISLHIGTVGSHFFWMGSARNKHRVWCKENARSAKLPCDFSIFQAIKLLSGKTLYGTSALRLLQTKLFLVFPGVHFNLKQKLINPFVKTTQQNEAPFIYIYNDFLGHISMLYHGVNNRCIMLEKYWDSPFSQCDITEINNRKCLENHVADKEVYMFFFSLYSPKQSLILVVSTKMLRELCFSNDHIPSIFFFFSS